VVLWLVNAKRTEYNSFAWSVIRFATHQPIISVVSDQTTVIKGDSVFPFPGTWPSVGFHFSPSLGPSQTIRVQAALCFCISRCSLTKQYNSNPLWKLIVAYLAENSCPYENWSFRTVLQKEPLYTFKHFAFKFCLDNSLAFTASSPKWPLFIMFSDYCFSHLFPSCRLILSNFFSFLYNSTKHTNSEAPH
jgi:hypothetical protein